MTWTNRNSTMICMETEEEISVLAINHAEEPDNKANFHVELYDPKSDYREYLADTQTWQEALKELKDFIKCNPEGSVIEVKA